jgi:hypothetical protein
MDNLLVIAAVAAAVGFMLWRARKRSKPGCGSDCGCGVKEKDGLKKSGD